MLLKSNSPTSKAVSSNKLLLGVRRQILGKYDKVWHIERIICDSWNQMACWSSRVSHRALYRNHVALGVRLSTFQAEHLGVNIYASTACMQRKAISETYSLLRYVYIYIYIYCNYSPYIYIYIYIYMYILCFLCLHYVASHVRPTETKH